MINKPYPYYTTPNLKDLREFIEFCGTEYAERIAFRWLEKKTEKSKTYKEFEEDIAALGTYFLAKGYNRTHIAVIGENSYEWIITYFAVVNSNNIIVPLDKEATVDDLKYFVEESDTTVIVHSNDYLEEMEATGCKTLVNMKTLNEIIEEGKSLIANGNSEYENIIIDKNAMSTIVYTSGTTSKPKGIMLSHKCILADTIATSKSILVPDSSMIVLPLNHTYTIVAAVTVPLLVGSSNFINRTLKNLMSDMVFCKPKFMAVVPLMMDTFYNKIIEKLKATNKYKVITNLVALSNALRKIGIDLRRKLFAKILESFGGNLELVAVGGAPINAKTVTGLTEFGITIVGGYGTSECSPLVSAARNKDYCPDSVGSVFSGVDVRIVNSEIQVKGDIVFLGYYKDPKATEDAFDGEWYKTGDIGELKDGLLYITGRCKNLIVLSNGKNISPESIEMHLTNSIPKIEDVVVYSQDDIIVAEIYLSQSSLEIEQEILNSIDEVNKELPTYKRISKTIFRKIPFERTTSKKIKRNNLGGAKNAWKNQKNSSWIYGR